MRRLRPRTVERLVWGALVGLLSVSLFLRSYLALELSIALLIGNIAFFRLRKHATAIGESEELGISARPAQNGPRDLMVLGGLVLVVLLCLNLLVATIGTKRTVAEIMVWTALFTAFWATGMCARTPIVRASAVGTLFAVTILARASVWYSFPAGPLASDPWFHLSLVDYTLETGRIYPDTTYSAFPAMHSLITQAVLVAGIDPRAALAISVGFPMSWVSVGIFLIVREMYDFESGLTAAVMASTAADVFQWGIVLVPTSFAIPIAVLVLYSVLRNRYRAPHILLALICLATITLAHTIVAFVLFALLALFFVGARLAPGLTGRRYMSSVRIGFVTVVGVTVIGYWMYVAGVFPFIVDAISFGFRIETFNPPLSSSSEPLVYFYRIGASALLALALMGTMTLIHVSPRESTEPRQAMKVTFAIGAWLFAGVETLLLVGSFTALFPARWIAVGSLMQTPLAGSGLALIRRSRIAGHRKLLSLGVMFIFILIMLVHPLSNAAPVLPGDSGLTIGLTAGERQGAIWVTRFLPGPYYTDTFFQPLFYQPGRGFISQASDGTGILMGQGLEGWFVYRTVLDTQPGEATQSGSTIVVTFSPAITQSLKNEARARIYDDGAVVIVGN